MRKRIFFTICGLLIASGIVFYACEKEKLFHKAGTVKSHASAAFYDQKLLNQFMQLPLVDQFAGVINSYLLTVNNGILSFKNEKDFNEVYDTLIYFSNEWDLLLEKNPSQYADYTKSDSFPDFPMLFAFEVLTDFYSLRAQIERDLFQMQAKGGIDEKTNPDNHYTVSDFLRTLLSPDCESIIGSWIVLYGESQSLIIQHLDFDKLDRVKTLWHKYGETDGTMHAFEQQLAMDIEEGNWSKGDSIACPDCNKFTIKADVLYGTECPHTFKFSAYIDGKRIDVAQQVNSWPQSKCDVIEVKWKFENGQTSFVYSDSPTHTYTKAGTYTATATMKRRDGTTCLSTTTVTVKDCNVNLVTPTRDATYLGCGVQYKIKVTPFHCQNKSATSYKLSFVNSTIPPQTKTTGEFTQIFICDGPYNIKVEVTFADGCKSDATQTFNVTGTGDCKQKKDHEKQKDISTCSGYKINHHFRVWSSAGLNRVYVKNVHYKKNSLGWWILKKADRMEASFWGKVVYGNADCSSQTPVYPNGKTNSGKSTLLYDYPMGQKFSVSRKAVHSSWKVKSSSSCSWASNSDELQLHDNFCGN
ncbi:MAG: PKD domain-containing protein [Bacteroidales bacterium]|jgi:PKD repeat protein|nr:PKD domain-containing protein [Bacteroidales bacterium]